MHRPVWRGVGVEPKRTSIWKLVARSFLLLATLQVLDRAVFPRLPLPNGDQKMAVQVLLGFAAAVFFLWPLARDFFAGNRSQSQRKVSMAVVDLELKSKTERSTNRRKAAGFIALELALVGVIWVAISGLLPVVLANNGHHLALLRHGVLLSAFISFLIVLTMPLDWQESGKGFRVRMSQPLLVTLAIAAIGCGVVPAIVLLVSIPTFSASDYLHVVFPVWYLLLPIAALGLRQYRGA